MPTVSWLRFFSEFPKTSQMETYDHCAHFLCCLERKRNLFFSQLCERVTLAHVCFITDKQNCMSHHHQQQKGSENQSRSGKTLYCLLFEQYIIKLFTLFFKHYFLSTDCTRVKISAKQRSLLTGSSAVTMLAVG